MNNLNNAAKILQERKEKPTTITIPKTTPEKVNQVPTTEKDPQNQGIKRKALDQLGPDYVKVLVSQHLLTL